MKPITKELIVELLSRNDQIGMHSVGRALVVLYNNQTADEQQTRDTNETNGKGYSKAHADIGTSMAQFYLKNGFLTPKQVQYWQRPTSSGRVRIAIYWKQILEAAIAKQAAKEVVEG
jgi:hypothetical protein